MPQPQNLLIFGDSIAYGAWDIHGGWADRLKKHREELRLKDHTYYITYNLGIPGETVLGLQQRFENENIIRLSAGKEKNGAVFAYGMNDLIPISNTGRTVEPETFGSIYTEVLNQAKNLFDSVLVLGITPIIETADPDSILGRTNKAILEYNEIIKEIVQKLDIEYLDLFQTLSSNGNFSQCISSDGLHPNSNGHELIFNEVTQHFDK